MGPRGGRDFMRAGEEKEDHTHARTHTHPEGRKDGLLGSGAHSGPRRQAEGAGSRGVSSGGGRGIGPLSQQGREMDQPPGMGLGGSPAVPLLPLNPEGSLVCTITCTYWRHQGKPDVAKEIEQR